MIDVAAIFATSSRPSVMAGSEPVSAWVIVLYPTPKTFGSQMPMTPTSRPPTAALLHSGIGTFSNASSVA